MLCSCNVYYVYWFRYHTGYILAERLPAQTAVSFTNTACRVENIWDPLQWTQKWLSSCAIKGRCVTQQQRTVLTYIVLSKQAVSSSSSIKTSTISAAVKHSSIQQHSICKICRKLCWSVSFTAVALSMHAEGLRSRLGMARSVKPLCHTAGKERRSCV